MIAGSRQSSSNGDNYHGSASSKLDMAKALQQLQHQLDSLSRRMNKEDKMKGKYTYGHQECKSTPSGHGLFKKHQEDRIMDQYLPLPNMNLSPFKGEEDPSIFLDWLAKVEQIFDLYSVDNFWRVKLATLALEGYVTQWLTRMNITTISAIKMGCNS
ncbi:hypothetical protein LR48_Vigan233s001500 [Vigna angularis]|uniref:Retrotransposon gag domain-containing protein n=1 Tax=Phaseolus angularis TaxID=3914 RepID=A0A0L9T6E2_PHAAN|nr:hypothetical protein LR48_Vigan233s001500 [Vigna angularis]